ncbi:acetamidase/formamidase family protein [Arthrobacter crystallopoietes]|uniref:Amidase n=1 Tax=Crystallibacter crystallopoietes TaxID=37928 RepID=A0A1H1CVU1_9MICC|nr:acetamidase/formamidase family protein [Arthrobacter crystallopoietes]AUI50582.1 hypothetical protein AC20117_06810 [Arthrobacter crystallopoietes]SDQ68333.1 amidase [Arthrobacter crystallopoietes]
MHSTQTLQDAKRVALRHASATFSAESDPVLEVAEGEPFIIEASSLLTGGLFETTTDYAKLSIPVTGPVAVTGAQPGDALRIDIHEINIDDRGAMVTLPGRGGFSRTLEKTGRIVEIVHDEVLFDAETRIPIRPMVGKIGLAPSTGTPNSSTVGAHGGNMDCKDVVAGSSVILPVQVAGAFLSAGDLHAVQGDGECSLTAVEVAGNILLSCSVIAGAAPRRPVVLSGGSVITIGDGESLDEAASHALDDMLALLQADRRWPAEKAAMLLSAAADVGVTQLVNARASVKVSLSTRYFNSPLFVPGTSPN